MEWVQQVQESAGWWSESSVSPRALPIVVMGCCLEKALHTSQILCSRGCIKCWAHSPSGAYLLLTEVLCGLIVISLWLDCNFYNFLTKCCQEKKIWVKSELKLAPDAMNVLFQRIPFVRVCICLVFLLCVTHRLSPEDWPLLGQSQTVSLLRPVLLPVLSPWRHHHYTLTHGA